MLSQPARVRDVLPHVPALDGVRGTAILLVLAFHLLWSGHGGSRWLDFFVQLRGAGWVGVDLFLALSGFLITGILYDSLGDRRYFRNFYGRRMLRIFPLYYAVVLGLLVLFWWRHAWGDLRLVGWCALYLQNTAAYTNHMAHTAAFAYSGHLWSLAVEEQFYLVWPVLVYLVRDRVRLLWLAGGLALVAPLSRWLLVGHGSSYEMVYRLTFCRQDSLLAGAMLALLLRGPNRERVLRAALPVFLFGFAACCGIAWHEHTFDRKFSYLINVFGYSFVALAAAGLVGMAIRPGSLAGRCMDARVLRFFGKYSYGIYVFHLIVLAGPVGGFAEGSLPRMIHSHVLYHLASMAVVLAVTIPLALVSFHLYERPFLRMKRFFNYGPKMPSAAG